MAGALKKILFLRRIPKLLYEFGQDFLDIQLIIGYPANYHEVHQGVTKLVIEGDSRGSKLVSDIEKRPLSRVSGPIWIQPFRRSTHHEERRIRIRP